MEKVSEEAEHGTQIRIRIEITIRTDKITTIRRCGCARIWCRQCGCEVDVVQAEILTGRRRMLDIGAEAHEWRCFEGPDGTPLECLDSVLKPMM